LKKAAAANLESLRVVLVIRRFWPLVGGAEVLVSRLLNPEEHESQPEPPKEQHLDPNVREAPRSLERALGVKVEIQDRKGKGKIILKYGSLEDFDRILESLGK